MANQKYLSYDGLVELVAKIHEKYAPIKAFIYLGSVQNVAALPSVAGVRNGGIYNVEEESTTTADFVEGAGKKLQAGENVVAVNTGTEADPIMKWDILGGVFDFTDRLQFGDTMPSTDLTAGRTFLYLGDTTYTYSEVTPTGDENPQALGWYELVSDEYVLSTDTTVDDQKTYYTRAEQYVKGVIYKYNTSTSSWDAQSSGDIMVAITNSEIDALFA